MAWGRMRVVNSVSVGEGVVVVQLRGCFDVEIGRAHV